MRYEDPGEDITDTSLDGPPTPGTGLYHPDWKPKIPAKPRINPFTGHPYGKPHQKVRERVARWANLMEDDPNLMFQPVGLFAYMLATVIESPSCWPRVLDGTMTQDRFQERTLKMRDAILQRTLR